MNSHSNDIVNEFVINGFEKKGFSKKLRTAYNDSFKEAEVGEDGEDVDMFIDCLSHDMPKRVPDAYKINKHRKNITWLEVDDCHPTSDNKMDDLAWFNDILTDSDWGLTLIIIKVKPVPLMMIWSPSKLIPTSWRFSRPRIINLPSKLEIIISKEYSLPKIDEAEFERMREQLDSIRMV